MRIFYFNRKIDVSGCSGTGRVADGIEFDDGKVAVRWRSSTASTELWDSLEACVQIHGHGGATVPVFINDEIESRSGNDLDELMRILESQQEESPDKAVKALQKALTHALPGVYVSFDGDGIGNAVARAEAQDDEPAIQDISMRIRAGGDLFEQWVRRHDGVLLEAGGDEGVAKVPEKALEDIETFRSDYERLVAASVTVGVGKKISEATKARMLGKLKGKNRTEMHTGSTDAELKAAVESRGPQDEVAKLREAGLVKSFQELADLLKKKSDESDLFQTLEFLEKAAKPLPIGTVHTWSGKKYQKQAQGWIPVPVQGGGEHPNDDAQPRHKKGNMRIERRSKKRDVDAGGHIKRDLSAGPEKKAEESPIQAASSQHRENQQKTIINDGTTSLQQIMDDTLHEMSPSSLNFSSSQKTLAKHIDYSKIERIPNTATTKFGGVVGTTVNGKGTKVLVKSALPSEDVFSTAHKEVAYFNCSRFFGLSNLIPEAAGDMNEGQYYSVAEWKHGTRPYDPRDREHFQPLIDDGTLHKAAIMNLVLGNVDRHGGNWLVKDNDLVLIDNGFSFGYGGGAALPGSGGTIKPRLPRYLRILVDDDPGELQEPDFENAIQAIDTPENVSRWIHSLSEERLTQLMEQSNVPENVIQQAVANLQKAKEQVEADPSFGRLCSVLLSGVSPKRGESDES